MSKIVKSRADREMDDKIVQFSSVTGASAKEARRYLTKYKRLEQALDAYYNDPSAGARSTASTSKLNALFDKYKDPDGDDITVDGTIRLCEDLGVNPEDVVLLAVAYELKSPAMGQWTRKGWTDGWKALGTGHGARLLGPPHPTRPLRRRARARAVHRARRRRGRGYGGECAGGGVERGVHAVVVRVSGEERGEGRQQGCLADAAWPSTIDDFVEYARNRLAGNAQ
ncbi:hypothetical protein BV20DRAFT_375929 [Pilatotrama ljubarskyi]|nr:hypothetical protein BV20DRAFT_375929 [Pilatotrama ljubarskyi]